MTSEVYYLHEMCQPSISHTTAMRQQATSLVTGFAPPSWPAVGHHAIGIPYEASS